MNLLHDVLEQLESPVLLAGDAHTAYRDPAVCYANGVFHLYFTLVETEESGEIYMYVGTTATRDFRTFTPVRKLTVRDRSRNFSSPGCVLRFQGGYRLCFQSYCRENGEIYGNGNSRLYMSRSTDLTSWSAPELLRVKGPDVPEQEMGRMIDPFLFFDRSDPEKVWCFFKQNGISRSWSRDLAVWHPAAPLPGGENVCVIPEKDGYLLWHSPANGVQLWSSDDLEHWKKEGEPETLGQKDWPWARGRLTAGFVLDLRNDPDVGTALLFFHGTDPEDESVVFDQYACIGLAWSDDLRHWRYPGFAEHRK